jgi:hypothetical protein
MEHDVRVENHGTVLMFRVLTDAAEEWVDDHLDLEPWQWLGNGFAVNHHYASDIITGMSRAGLTITS